MTNETSCINSDFKAPETFTDRAAGKAGQKKLLIIGSTARSIDILLYAKSIDVYTIVTDYLNTEDSKAKQYADECWLISTTETDELEERCRREKVDAIFCGVNEFCLEQVMELCKRLDLPCYCNEAAWHYSRDKYDFKKICKDCGVPVAEDFYLSDALTEEELSSVKYPVVVKPVDLLGNEGVSYCYNQEQLIAAYKYARSVSENPRIIVERMFVGREWYTNYALAGGEIRQISLNEMLAQPGELKNIYSITTTCTNNVERVTKEINPAIESALRKIGCREGIAWVQIMQDQQDDQFYVLEMGYRFTSDNSDIAFPFLFGFDTTRWVLDYSLGKKHAIKELPKSQEHAYDKCSCGYSIWTHKAGRISSMSGFDEINREEGISCYPMIRIGYEFCEHTCLGAISISADDIDGLCNKIRFINESISIRDENGDDVIIRFTDFETIKANYLRGQLEKKASV